MFRICSSGDRLWTTATGVGCASLRQSQIRPGLSALHSAAAFPLRLAALRDPERGDLMYRGDEASRGERSIFVGPRALGRVGAYRVNVQYRVDGRDVGGSGARNNVKPGGDDLVI